MQKNTLSGANLAQENKPTASEAEMIFNLVKNAQGAYHAYNTRIHDYDQFRIKQDISNEKGKSHGVTLQATRHKNGKVALSIQGLGAIFPDVGTPSSNFVDYNTHYDIFMKYFSLF